MADPFYRTNERELAAGALNLVNIVTPAPVLWGLSVEEIAAYAAKASAFSSALAIANTPLTRTQVAVEAKNLAKKELMQATVNVARTIAAVATVSNAQLLKLGLRERPNPQPRAAPSEAPIIELVAVIGRRVKVRVHDGSATKRKKPATAIGVNLFSFVGPEAPTDPRAYAYEGMSTRPTADIEFGIDVPSGATVWLSAQWVGARGKMSRGSSPIPFTLQGGAVTVAA